MSGLHYDDVMEWGVEEVLSWLQKNNLGIFRTFVVAENIDGPSLIQLDKRRVANVKGASNKQKDNLCKLLNEMVKGKEKKEKGKSFFKGSAKGANGSAATAPSKVQPPSSARPQLPPPDHYDDNNDEDEYGDDSEEWDDDQDVYDNDMQPPKRDVEPKGHRPPPAIPVAQDSDDGDDYVNPDQEIENRKAHETEEPALYEVAEPTIMSKVNSSTPGNSHRPVPPPTSLQPQRAAIFPPASVRGPVPPPTPITNDDEFYESPEQDEPATPPPPSLSSSSSSSSQFKNQKGLPPPPEHAVDAIYEMENEAPLPPPPSIPSTPPSKVSKAPPPQAVEALYEATDMEGVAPKGRGPVPPAPKRNTPELVPDKAPEIPDRRQRKPAPPPTGHQILEAQVQHPERQTTSRNVVSPPVLPATKKSTGYCQVSVPAPLLPAVPPQEIYEETPDMDAPPPPTLPGRDRAPLPAPPEDFYEPPPESSFPMKATNPQPSVGGRPPAPIPQSPEEDEEFYVTEDDIAAGAKSRDADSCSLSSQRAPLPPTPATKIAGLVSAAGLGVDSVALRGARGNLRKAVTNFKPTQTETAREEPTQKFPAAIPAKCFKKPSPQLPPISSCRIESKAPGGPEPARAHQEKEPPGAPPIAGNAAFSKAATRLPVQDPNDITTQPWYFGDYDSVNATTLLKKSNEDGTFLVRASKRSGHLYTLGIYYKGDTFNIPIRKRSDGKFALGSEKADEHVFETVYDMVRFHRNNAIEVSKDSRIVGRVKLENIPGK